jgi:hypothetical protein
MKRFVSELYCYLFPKRFVKKIPDLVTAETLRTKCEREEKSGEKKIYVLIMLLGKNLMRLVTNNEFYMVCCQAEEPERRYLAAGWLVKYCMHFIYK